MGQPQYSTNEDDDGNRVYVDEGNVEEEPTETGTGTTEVEANESASYIEKAARATSEVMDLVSAFLIVEELMAHDRSGLEAPANGLVSKECTEEVTGQASPSRVGNECNCIHGPVEELDPEKINEPDQNGDTKLHHAVQAGNDALVGQLLQMGADPRKKNRLMKTPLHMVARGDDKSCGRCHVNIIERFVGHGGDLAYGLKHGWGTGYYPDGSQYTGYWFRGHIHGWGVYMYPNGDEYEGWFFMGAKHGRGIYRTKATGEKFVGDWLLGLKHGSGSVVRPDYKFTGKWANDVPEGIGVYIFPELGVEQVGTFIVVRVPPRFIEKFEALGYQIKTMPASPPRQDPIKVEAKVRNTLIWEDFNAYYGASDLGEGDDMEDQQESGTQKSMIPPEVDLEIRIAQKLKKFVQREQKSHKDEVRRVTLVWTVKEIRKIRFPRLGMCRHVNVPPPLIPPTPIIPDSEIEKQREGEDQDENAASGACQLQSSRLCWPAFLLPPGTFYRAPVVSDSDEAVTDIMDSLTPHLEQFEYHEFTEDNSGWFRGQALPLPEEVIKRLQAEEAAERSSGGGDGRTSHKEGEAATSATAGYRPDVD